MRRLESAPSLSLFGGADTAATLQIPGHGTESALAAEQGAPSAPSQPCPSARTCGAAAPAMGAEDEPPASSEDSEPPPPAEEPEDAFGRVNVLDYLDTTHLVALLCVAFGAVCWLALRWKKERDEAVRAASVASMLGLQGEEAEDEVVVDSKTGQLKTEDGEVMTNTSQSEQSQDGSVDLVRRPQPVPVN